MRDANRVLREVGSVGASGPGPVKVQAAISEWLEGRVRLPFGCMEGWMEGQVHRAC